MMKRRMLLAAVSVLVVAAAIVVQTARTRPTHRSARLEVAELAAHPADHLGDVLVAGTVSKIDAAKSLVLLSDRAGCTSCDSGCSEEGAQVPVRWSGKLPKAGDRLLVRGWLTKQAAGFVLTGSSAGAVPPLRARGTKAKGGR